MKLLAFARALLERWDRRVVSPRPLGLVFRQPPTPPPARRHDSVVTHTHVRRNLHVDLRPNIALTVVRPAAAAAIARQHELVSSTASIIERSAGRDLVLRNTSLLTAERLVERVLSRSKRVEVLVRPGPKGTVASALGSMTTPPPLVIQHGAPEQRRPAEPQTARRAPAAQPAPAIPTDVDLARLTDHVVTAIDSRLTAQAERLGRG